MLTTSSEPAEESTVGYGDWSEFWTVFSRAAASGDEATIEPLMADELVFIYAGGSINKFTGTKDDLLGGFALPNQVFEQGRRTFDDGTVFSVEFLSPGQGMSAFDGSGVAYDVAYSVMIEAGVGGPPSYREYIFRKVEGRFLLVGYSVDH